MKLESGDSVDERFEIVSLIGRGGMGSVYRATQTQLNRPVALKILDTIVTADSQSLARLERESLAVSSLRHRNIVSFYSCGVWNQFPYLALEFVDGQNLQELLDPAKPLTLALALSIAEQVCKALAHSHRAGLIHRDLKPSNIMLVRSDEEDLVKVIDFGLAKLLPEFGQEMQKLTQTGTIVGTPMYMSPEQCTGVPVDHRTDLYALGGILHHCLTGQPPFDHTGPKDPMAMHMELMVANLHDTPPPLSSVSNSSEVYSENLQSLVYKALAKRPEDRYQSAESMLQDLQALKEGRDLGLTSTYRPAQGSVHRKPKAGVVRSNAAVIIGATTLLAIGYLCVDHLGFGSLAGKDKVAVSHSILPLNLAVRPVFRALRESRTPTPEDAQALVESLQHTDKFVDYEALRDAHGTLACYYEQRGDFLRRDREFTALLAAGHAIHRFDSTVVENWAHMLVEHQQYKEAEVLLLKAVAWHPNDPPYTKQLNRVLKSLRQDHTAADTTWGWNPRSKGNPSHNMEELEKEVNPVTKISL